MFDVGGGEILLIVLAILLLFGPRKIPEIATMVGNGMRKVRRAQEDFTQHLRDLSTELEQSGDTASAEQKFEQPEMPLVDAPVAERQLDVMTPDEESVTTGRAIAPQDAPDESSERSTVAIRPVDGSVSR